jgi:hypothetical protein
MFPLQFVEIENSPPTASFWPGCFHVSNPCSLNQVLNDNFYFQIDQARMDGEDVNLRKRNRDSLASASSSPESTAQDRDSDLEFSLKKVRISKQVPGQLRLQQDVAECMNRARELSLEVIRVDAKNPLSATVKLINNRELYISVGRFYPHQPPTITSLPDGHRIRLPILDNWMPVNTLANVLSQIRNPGEDEAEMIDL